MPTSARPTVFRAAVVLAMVLVVAVAWAVRRTAQRADESAAQVAHTQEVLSAAEAVLDSIADAAVLTTVDRLAALTGDDPDQRARVSGLRDAIARAAANPSAGPPDLDAPRRALQQIRVEEQRLLAVRTQAAREAVVGLQRVTAVLALVGAAILACLIWLLDRTRSRALGDTNARLQSIIDSAVDGIIVIDAKGVVEAFNRAAERLFGYPAADIIGRNISTLMPSPDREAHEGYLARYLETGAAKIIGIGREVTGRRRDGTTFPLHLSVGEMSIAGEKKFTGVLHDLTERTWLDHRLRASEARWRAVIETASDGVVVIDASGLIEACNPAAERLFGYAEHELVGRNVNVLMPAPYREEHDGYLARYLETGTKTVIGTGREVSGLRRDGTSFPVHLSVGELTVDGARKFTGILHDLSARVRMEERLREQTSLARLGEMAAVLAHEIKNPLAGVRGAIQVVGSHLPADSRDGGMIKEIISRIDALNQLMNDLLVFARPPQPRFAPVEMNALVAVTADLLSTDPALKDIRVTVDGSAPPVPADAELLKIAFTNLLVNGAHAMQGRGTIRVSVAVTGASCQVTFADTGPGIAPDVRDKLFTPFFTTKARGSGLGLPTVRRLVEAHHGTVSVDCPPGGGTTVTICLPAQAVA